MNDDLFLEQAFEYLVEILGREPTDRELDRELDKRMALAESYEPDYDAQSKDDYFDFPE